MRKLIYLEALSVFLLDACSDSEPPIPEDKVIERPIYKGEPIETPKLSDEVKNSPPQSVEGFNFYTTYSFNLYLFPFISISFTCNKSTLTPASSK